MSGFAFIGAQKHGKFVKSLVEPKAAPSIENAVLAETSVSRIAAGPSGPPTGPSGPPTGPTGPTGPPTGPTGPPVQEELATSSQPDLATEAISETPVEPEQVAPVEDVYEDQGDGWYFRKKPDGSYDQQVYVIKDGFYVPYEEPNA